MAKKKAAKKKPAKKKAIEESQEALELALCSRPPTLFGGHNPTSTREERSISPPGFLSARSKTLRQREFIWQCWSAILLLF